MFEDNPNCVLYIKNKIVITASDSDQTLDQLKEELKGLFSAEDLKEREEPEKINEDILEDSEENDKIMTLGEDIESSDYDPDPFEAGREMVEPFYLCDELKSIETPRFNRLTLGDDRYYIRALEDGTAKIYASVTTLIKDGYVDDKTALQEWKSELKMLGQNPEEVARYEADKGTIMHALYGLYLTGRDMVLSRGFLIRTIKQEKLKISKANLDRFFASTDDLDDMLSRLMKFAKFCYDYKVKVMAIEKILCLDDYCVATPIDAIVRMSFKYKEEGYFGEVYKRASGEHKAGDPKLSTREVEKEEVVILDFKSGGIWDSYAFQLEAERRMVKNWYGIDARIMNFSPKGSSNKGYTLKEWTSENAVMEKADCVFQQGMINHLRKQKKYTMRKGVLNINKPYNEEDYTMTYDIAEEMSKE